MTAAFAGQRVFITGATGLIGGWLTRRLVEAGAQVVVLLRDWDPASALIRSGLIHRVEVVSGTLEDGHAVERALAEHEPAHVFHLAAQTIVGTALRSPVATFEANVRGTWLLLEACRRVAPGLRSVVVASSDKAYGDAPVLPYREDMPAAGRHPYDVSKSCTDLIALTYAHTYDVPVVVTRCGNVYGGGDLNWSRIVPGTIRSLLRGERPMIRSDGTFRRDYVYADDVALAYLRCAERIGDPGVRGEAFNFGPETPLSVLEMVAHLQRLMGRDDLTPDIRNDARAEIRDQYLDSTKARERLSWTPTYALDHGLAETIAWYRQFLGAA
jgi:CDP-glucose 4,6-dehydratase